MRNHDIILHSPALHQSSINQVRPIHPRHNGPPLNRQSPDEVHLHRCIEPESHPMGNTTVNPLDQSQTIGDPGPLYRTSVSETQVSSAD